MSPTLFSFGATETPPQWARTSSSTRFLDHTQRLTKVGRTPLYGWSFRRRDLYLTTHNNHNQQTSMPPVGFEPTFSTCERPQTYSLDRAATGIGASCITKANLTTYKNEIKDLPTVLKSLPPPLVLQFHINTVSITNFLRRIFQTLQDDAQGK